MATHDLEGLRFIISVCYYKRKDLENKMTGTPKPPREHFMESMPPLPKGVEVTGDVKFNPDYREEAERAAERVGVETDALKRLERDYRDKGMNPDQARDAVDRDVADMLNTVSGDKEGAERLSGALFTSVVEVGMPGEQPKTAGSVNKVCDDNPEVCAATLEEAELGGVHIKEVTRELDVEKRHEEIDRLIKELYAVSGSSDPGMPRETFDDIHKKVEELIKEQLSTHETPTDESRELIDELMRLRCMDFEINLGEDYTGDWDDPEWFRRQDETIERLLLVISDRSVPAELILNYVEHGGRSRIGWADSRFRRLVGERYKESIELKVNSNYLDNNPNIKQIIKHPDTFYPERKAGMDAAEYLGAQAEYAVNYLIDVLGLPSDYARVVNRSIRGRDLAGYEENPDELKLRYLNGLRHVMKKVETFGVDRLMVIYEETGIANLPRRSNESLEMIEEIIQKKPKTLDKLRRNGVAMSIEDGVNDHNWALSKTERQFRSRGGGFTMPFEVGSLKDDGAEISKYARFMEERGLHPSTVVISAHGRPGSMRVGDGVISILQPAEQDAVMFEEKGFTVINPESSEAFKDLFGLMQPDESGKCFLVLASCSQGNRGDAEYSTAEAFMKRMQAELPEEAIPEVHAPTTPTIIQRETFTGMLGYAIGDAVAYTVDDRGDIIVIEDVESFGLPQFTVSGAAYINTVKSKEG